MLFNSYEFLVLFLPITLLIYYLPCFRKYQLYILILAGFVFYAFNHLEFLCLLICSALLNAVSSYLTQVTVDIKMRKIYALSGVVLNLCLLGFFKYGTLVYHSFFEINQFGEWLVTLPLPIGISFYTFQGISLLVDVFKNEKNNIILSEKNFIKHIVHTIFFISFFPHSIAGPIVKAHTFLPQIAKKNFSDIKFEYVFRILVQGYFLKTVIADNIQDYTFWITYPYFLEQSSITLVSMMFGFSVQIFADFAGYSLIAIGVAALFGYKLPDNFNFPYISQSFSEFWQRWHMSLSAWLKEYLYIPLGGNRKGKLKTYINLLIVMLLGGMWHGAAWNYLFWGGVHGVALAVERFYLHSKLGSLIENKVNKYKLYRFFQSVLVFIVVSWAWLFFKLPNFEHAILYTKAIFSNAGKENDTLIILYCLFYSIPIFLYHMKYLLREHWFVKKIKKYEVIVYAIMLFFILCNGGNSDAFIYFQF